MYLDDILASQKRGEAAGVTSVCSAHPDVIGQALQAFRHPLIEATCNQVNQFGGYTGMTPKDFAGFVHRLADELQIAFNDIILGGDHLGPHVWRNEPAGRAMELAKEMLAQYVEAGFTKLHLDCSMSLGDDLSAAPEPTVAAQRAAELAAVAERHGDARLRYVIGTEVPYPGGAVAHEDHVRVTEVDNAGETMEMHRQAFHDLGLESAWDRVVAIVVQPGVEFGDDFVMPYRPEAAQALSKFIGDQSLVYEAHSTDYQSREALKNLVRDHFAILKVGPALTFAYREAILALAMIENECIKPEERSNVLGVLEHTMTAQPEHWRDYYLGSEEEQAFKRKFSLSDRIRYYWALPDVQRALEKLMHNLGDGVLSYSLSSQFLGETGLSARQAIRSRIGKVLNDYSSACEIG